MANHKTTAAEEPHDPETGEVTETKAALPAVVVNNGVATINGQAFEIAEKVTLPLLAQQNGMTYFVRIDSEVYTGKEIKGSKMQAADMIRVTNLVDGHEYEMICNAVVVAISPFQKRANIGLKRVAERRLGMKPWQFSITWKAEKRQ